ncbi:hypothetical protein NQ314_018146 [Rhamnusium bicolor]|uniref:protein-serine/threonine phosphatase n=1 Tax=Rhamnusium bicolor TaxID=1586634 RepID=A0AAV8WSH0_9CUCU|nr:hypothetical protein NQ314_018146 [Rhamnusium bicolor]
MAEKTVCISQQQSKPIKILKWKVREGVTVSIGRLLLLYDFVGAKKEEQRKLKSTQAGTVNKIIALEGDTVKRGEILLELKACCHPTIMNDMCAECGADLRKDDIISTASVPMIHAIPDLKVSEELAQKLGQADCERLIKDRKLVLLVDLDQTLIHTTNDNIPPNIKDVYHFQLYGPSSPWYHTRLRPGTHRFLNDIHNYYELHICTFGARNYAHTIAMFLDPDQKIFSNRILSRDECFDPTNKHEHDNKAGVDLTKIKNKVVLSTDHMKDKELQITNGSVEKHAEEKILHNCNGKNDCEELLKINGNQCKTNEVSINTSGREENITNDEVMTDRKEEDENDGSLNECGEKSNDLEESDVKDMESRNLKVNKEDSTVVQTESETNEGTKNNTNNASVETEENLQQTHKIVEVEKSSNEDNLIEIEDPDDYLVYLEEVLKMIHREFYEQHDKMKSGGIPDLKKVIPLVRSNILKGCKLVFSGLVPTHIKLEQSKAYQVAKSLGAVVTQDIEDDTTHLVAVRPGTAKKDGSMWMRIYFHLRVGVQKNRHPPPHCSSPDHVISYPEHSTPALRKRTPSGRFMDTINPLMSFSSADIADMDKEVEDILDDESDSTDEESKRKREIAKEIKIVNDSSSSSSSEDSLTGEYPKGYKRRREEDKNYLLDEYNSTEDESPSIKFRRGESIEDILDMDQEDTQDSEGSLEPPDEVDDGEWNMMGAALEREFLSNN